MLRERVLAEMELVFKEIPYGIAHTMRVLANADEIMAKEGVSERAAEVVTYAAILHDIGAVRALKKYGSLDGCYQEIEGPAVAKDILQRVGVDEAVIVRVEYITGNHHTPAKIDDLDFQILWDADLLDGLEYGEKDSDAEHLRQKIESSFQTDSGKSLALNRLGFVE
ncbi:MAG: phosphohydrolase [Chloroflexi bacterium HGW-Chloroflexi-6]|nr:MAG: phosphohydrolase [Chloroflexi bacterium HGW-Chloroflexi-6]